MSTKEVGWAPSDPWFEPGFKNLITYRLEEAVIRIFPVPYFLATKFSAHNDRGGDPRMSKDFEDIVYVLDNRLNLVKEIEEAPIDVQEYLKSRLSELSNDSMMESVTCHLSSFSQVERLQLIKEKMHQIVLS